MAKNVRDGLTWGLRWEDLRHCWEVSPYWHLLVIYNCKKARMVNSMNPMPDVSDFWANTGVVLMIGGTITIYANWLHSIVDAVRSSNRINAENGYVMYQLNDRCAFGMQPSIAYERPQYLQGSKPEFSAGMNFKLTF